MNSRRGAGPGRPPARASPRGRACHPSSRGPGPAASSPGAGRPGGAAAAAAGRAGRSWAGARRLAGRNALTRRRLQWRQRRRRQRQRQRRGPGGTTSLARGRPGGRRAARRRACALPPGGTDLAPWSQSCAAGWGEPRQSRGHVLERRGPRPAGVHLSGFAPAATKVAMMLRLHGACRHRLAQTVSPGATPALVPQV